MEQLTVVHCEFVLFNCASYKYIYLLPRSSQRGRCFIRVVALIAVIIAVMFFQTDFTDTWTALRLFLCFSFF